MTGDSLRLLLLHLLREEDKHGYELMKSLEELSGGSWSPSPGVIYPALSLLHDQGLVREAESEGTRRKFQLSEDGRQELERKKQELEELLSRLQAAASSASELDPAPLRRAMDGLKQAVMAELSKSPTREQIVSLAHLIDELTQKIESR